MSQMLALPATQDWPWAIFIDQTSGENIVFGWEVSYQSGVWLDGFVSGMDLCNFCVLSTEIAAGS